MLGILLDTGPLGILCNPHAGADTVACHRWTKEMARLGATIYIPEICDYELRRELLRTGLSRSVHRLNELRTEYKYECITTELMLRAAQANILIDAGINVVIATENATHLSRFAPAARGQDIQIAS